jgi:hypothetical protein
MTRAERAAEQVRKAKEKLAEHERKAKEERAKQQEATRKAKVLLAEAVRKDDNKRRYRVGALAQDAGLFVWSDTDLAAVFAVLARLKETPHPAVLLDGVLGENGVDFPVGAILDRE